MLESETFFFQKYAIPSFLVNLRGQAGLYAILNFIQDIGWLHGQKLKVNLPKNKGWVFTRQKLSMDEWPHWKDQVTIRTWLRPPEGAFLLRDYQILVGDKAIGSCTSAFAMFDLEARKIAIPDWSLYKGFWSESEKLEQNPEKIIWQENGEPLAKFHVRNSDIDLNNHVNNAKYAQWVLDSIPIEILKNGEELGCYEVNFLAETKLGNEVQIEKIDLPESSSPVRQVQFQGRLTSNLKPVFTARLTVR